MAPYSSNVLFKLFDKFLDKSNIKIKFLGFYRCIEGKVNIAKKLSSLSFDIICFTGST
jgi:hypothetical protein